MEQFSKMLQPYCMYSDFMWNWFTTFDIDCVHLILKVTISLFSSKKELRADAFMPT
jgi:hypothetical protein